MWFWIGCLILVMWSGMRCLILALWTSMRCSILAMWVDIGRHDMHSGFDGIALCIESILHNYNMAKECGKCLSWGKSTKTW